MGTLISVLNLLQINNSVFVMLLIFVATYWVLRLLALGKLASTLKERDHRLEGRVDTAEKFYAEINELKTKVQTEMAKTQSTATQTFNDLKTKAQEKHRTILQAAKDNSQKVIGESRTTVAGQIQTEFKKIETEIPSLAKLMVEQILKSPKAQQQGQTLPNQGL
jgi:F0F1-type ATP synthase membrane subunit b/b'